MAARRTDRDIGLSAHKTGDYIYNADRNGKSISEQDISSKECLLVYDTEKGVISDAAAVLHRAGDLIPDSLVKRGKWALPMQDGDLSQHSMLTAIATSSFYLRDFCLMEILQHKSLVYMSSLELGTRRKGWAKWRGDRLRRTWRATTTAPPCPNGA